MKKLLLLLLMAITVVTLAACGNTLENSKDKKEDQASSSKKEDKVWGKIKDSGELVIGTSGTLAAASYYEGEKKEDGSLTGFDVEVAREVAKRLDLKPKFEIMGIDSMLPAIKSGRINIAANDIEITDKRKEQFDFSSPYKYSYTTMVVRKKDNSGIEKLEDLKGKKAGGGATTVYSQIAEHYGAEVVTYGNAGNEAYLRDVDNGRTDVVINDYFLCKMGVAAFPKFDIHLHPTLKFNPTETAVIMPKDSSTLQSKINDAMAEMKKDGTLSKLSEKFYGEDATDKPNEDIQKVEGLKF